MSLQEIDTPGHTAIIGTTYPDYVACFDESPWSTYANEPPAGQLRFPLPEVRDFTASLLADIAKTLPSTLFSTGGDELNTNCYAQDAETQQELKATGKTFEQALDTFTQTTHKALIAEGKRPAVWEGEDTLPSTDVDTHVRDRDGPYPERHTCERHRSPVSPNPGLLFYMSDLLILFAQSLDIVR